MTTAEKAGGKSTNLRPIILTVLIASVSFAASAYAASPQLPDTVELRGFVLFRGDIFRF
ncbi:MAG: hypothetical protein ACYSSO_07655 [Planctomycetota bacterium]|jgi:hypothetical protein